MPVIHDLRGVGENFRDHYGVRLVARVKNPTINEMATGLGSRPDPRWATGRPSILALSPSLVHWFWKSDETLDSADLQGVFGPASYKDGYIGRLDDFPGMTAASGRIGRTAPDLSGPLGRPVRRSGDPAQLPRRPDGPRVLLGGMKLARRLLDTRARRRISTARYCRPARQSDDELLDFARRYGSTCYHLVGTARMGPPSDPSAVVDDQLRVHGSRRACCRRLDHAEHA